MENNTETSSINRGVRQGFVEALRAFGFGDKTRVGAIKRVIVYPQLIFGAVFLPLFAYDIVGAENYSHTAEIVEITDTFPQGFQNVSFKLVEGPHQGLVGKTIIKDNRLNTGEQVPISYRNGRINPVSNVSIKH